jgi:hypothetical protein
MFLDEGLSAREITDKFNGRLTYASVRTYVSQIMRDAKEAGIHIELRKRGNLATSSRALRRMHFSIGINMLQRRLLKMQGMGAAA